MLKRELPKATSRTELTEITRTASINQSNLHSAFPGALSFSWRLCVKLIGLGLQITQRRQEKNQGAKKIT
jgi:hypothetical protein